ncbi:hypothetical protein CRE_31157 [Caenorhabditis remanei]|uniref:EF-hand domain-containing protein n=1 Tax=Caenorhabditis remanei TaxID=31234 RepID=E3LTG2_CAERE|nr:hypothetical protein CRE_31157 [Caenorhabditis remanei]
MEDKMKLKTIGDLKFPSIPFSPIATSSPKLTKMRAPDIDQSWASSSDDSTGNIASCILTGIDEMHIHESKSGDDSTTSSCSVHTALEFVDLLAFKNKTTSERITREELRTAIVANKMRYTDSSKEEAEIYAKVVTERILWAACRTWNGTIPVERKEDVIKYAQYANDDFYMEGTAQLCTEELQQLSEDWKYDRKTVGTFCAEKGMPPSIIDRLFTKNLVRRTDGDYLDDIEMMWLLFAIIGTDELQTSEYWFRVLDVQSTGVLSFTELENFYADITILLDKYDVIAQPYSTVITHFIDILGTDEWTLGSFKRNIKIVHKVLNGFISALRFLEQELDEKTNGERLEDQKFGEGERTRWQRLIDRAYAVVYHRNDSSSSLESSSTDE